MKVSDAITSRISCRAFLPDRVSEKQVRELLELAKCAPSGGNVQPWHVAVLAGKALDGLRREVAEAMVEYPRGMATQYRIYPKDLKQIYFDRRFKCGEDLYETLGIGRDDKKSRIVQFKKNFDLFGAPVGLFIYIDEQMGPPQWSDMGMYIQSLLLAAREAGLHTCAQEAWAMWHEIVARHTRPDDDLMLFCGIALGVMDGMDPVNTLKTDRAPLEEFATFRGF